MNNKELLTMTKLKKMLMEKRFVEILDMLKVELKRFCKRTAKGCPDHAYTWEDFFSVGTLGMWAQFKADKTTKRNTREYLHRAKWAIYDEIDKIGAQKRDKRRVHYDRQSGISYIQDTK